MKIRIRHRTTYRYSEQVAFSSHQLMIRPREGHDLHIDSSILDIVPAHAVHWMRDVNGNCIALVNFLEKSDRLMFYSELLLSHYDANPFGFILEERALRHPFTYDEESAPELAPYRQMVYPADTPAVRAWSGQFWKPGEETETLPLLQSLNRGIQGNFTYLRREKRGVQTPAETLSRLSGTCRDFAVLMLETCRLWGLAARFVTGYLVTDGTMGNSTHAWMEVYLPGAGWKGFDPTAGLMTGTTHVTVAVSRHPERASPIIGSYLGPPTAFLGIEVNVQVEKLESSPSRGATALSHQSGIAEGPGVEQAAQFHPKIFPGTRLHQAGRALNARLSHD
jgi:transglutaminase-like putative cysteine protease